MKSRPVRSLQNILFRLLLTHQLTALLLLVVIMATASYFDWRNYLDQQRQSNTMMAQDIGEYFSSASLVLRALANMPASQQALDAIEQTYKTFDVLYLINADGQLTGISPRDPQVPLGIDMSGQPFFQKGLKDIFISNMFISSRTGNPTVYLALPSANGGEMVAGELSLTGLEYKITRLNTYRAGVLYVIQHDGDLLAYPDDRLVREQVNVRQLGIDIESLQAQAQSYYQVNGGWVLGSVQEIPQTTWLAVVQIPVRNIFAPFVGPLTYGVLAAMALFALLMLQERKAVRSQVIAPLNRISQEAHYLAEGHYRREDHFIPQASDYLEIASLADSFERMKEAVIAREASLQASEERLRFAMEASSDGLWDWDIPSGDSHYSLGYLRILGYEPGEFPSKAQAWRDALHPEDRERTLQVNQDCIDNRRDNFEIEYRLRTKQGNWKWILARGKVVARDANGKALRMVGTHIDMTEKKQVELALRESRKQYKSLVDDLKEVVFQTDADGRWTFLNPAWKETTGFDVSASVDQVFLDTVYPEDYQRSMEIFQSLIHREKEECRCEFRFIHREGGFRWIQVWARLVQDEQGNVIGTAGTLTDVTERKQSEAAIRQLADELEQRVIERTASLEAANKELEAFSYSVSHDLRAPLRGIDGWSMILLEDYGEQLDEQAQRYLQRVRSEAQRMGHLIDELLTLSRASLMGMENSRVDFSELAQRVADRVQEAQPGRRIEWSIQAGLECQGDAALLENAIHNLFQNAAKFTSQCPAPYIEFGLVGTRLGDDGNGKVFFVRDNGVGFDSDYAQNLFGPFQRLHKASQFPGTGIGLTIVKRIIQRHGGKVWAESHAGQGATFFFTLETGPK